MNEPISSLPGAPVENETLLTQALTHRSFANNVTDASNERLEFLGDSVLGMIIAAYLFETYPDWDQGRLSKAKATVVMEGPLAEAGRRLGLDQHIRLGTSEAANGGRERNSILSDAFEALVAAVYIDQGIEAAREFVLTQLEPVLERIARGDIAPDDFKSRLQEITQALWRKTPTYRLDDETGDPHAKQFVVSVLIEHEVYGAGAGRSKKEAEQNAAQEAVQRLIAEQQV